MSDPLVSTYLPWLAVACVTAGVLYGVWRAVCWLDPDDDLLDVLGPKDADERYDW